MPRRNAKPQDLHDADYIKSVHVLARMRRTGEKLATAARFENIDPRKVIKKLPDEFRKSGRNWVPRREADRKPRQLNLLAPKGRRPGVVRGSKAASLLGKYNAALSKFFSANPNFAGDESLLEPFRGKRVAGVELLTDTQTLVELAEAGELSFDDLYAAPYGGAD